MSIGTISVHSAAFSHRGNYLVDSGREGTKPVRIGPKMIPASPRVTALSKSWTVVKFVAARSLQEPQKPTICYRCASTTPLSIDKDMEEALCLDMTDAQLDRCRKRLERFLVDLLEPVGRSERRHWGSVYVRGLLLNGERKSVEPMAKRLPDGNEQAMQQFVGQSPWDWEPVWERLARRMVRELEPDAVWVIDDTGFPKQGAHSVGVERQYSGTLGKT